jgi:hypothetical protein
MTDHLLIAALLVAFIWFMASVYHQAVIRPFLHDVARFRVFAVRDEIRAAAACGQVDPQSFPYQYLEDLLNSMVHLCGWYSVSALLEFAIACVLNPPTEGDVKEIERFENEASPWLREREHHAIYNMRPALIANSPCWVGIAFGLYAFKKVRRALGKALETQSRRFWHNDPTVLPIPH